MEKRTRLGYQEGFISIIINMCLFGLKYWAGIVSGSIALIADAWHTLSDTLSSLIVITGVKLSSRKPTTKHPYGYGRWEQIAAVFIAFLLGIVAYEFFRESIVKLTAHQRANFGTVAIIVTIISVLAKEGLAQYAFWIARKTGNTTIRADAWHHRSDALSSVVVLIGIFLRNYFWWIDSILGMIISAMLFYAVFDIIKDAINKLLGEEPPGELMTKIHELVDSLSDKHAYPHHFHIHKYGNHTELTFHIKVDENLSVKVAHELATKIEKEIRELLHIETTIHVEPFHSNH